MPVRIDLVERHHRRLLEIVGAARPLVDESVLEVDRQGLRYLRQEMVEALTSYARLIADMEEEAVGTPHDPALLYAQRLKAHCVEMVRSYEAFRARWIERTALDNWPEYRLSAVRMMKRIREEMIQATQVHAEADGTAVTFGDARRSPLRPQLVSS